MKTEFFKNFKLSGRGKAAVLCLCLAAASAAGIYNYNKNRLTAEKLLTGTSDAAAVSEEEAVGVQAVQKNIPEAKIPANDLMPGNAEDVFADSLPDEEAEPAADTAEDEPVGADNIPPDIISVGKNSPENTGVTVRPLDGEIITPYSNGELVKSGTLNVWRTHDGIDIAGSVGESVRAASAGKVTAVYRDTMWGNCVEIEHSGGIKSCYFGLADDVAVSEGDPVNAGTIIGTVGESAECEISEQPHLHFAMKKNGSWTDPAAALSGEGS